jgi:hypothetical protein
MIDLGVSASSEHGDPSRRARARRIALVVAAIAAVGLVAVGVVTWMPNRSNGPAPTHQPPGTAAVRPAATGTAIAGPAGIPVGVAVIVDNRLVLPDGTNIAIPGAETIRRGYKTLDGWLIEEPGGLWLVRPDHSVHRLSLESDVAVAPDGGGFAWRTTSTMSVGHLDGDTLVTDETVQAPAEGTPFRYTGAAVILGGGCCDGITKFDVWIPSKGPYVPSWVATAHVRGVDAVRPGTSHVIGQVAGPNGPKDTCLAELDPADNLRPVWTACGITRFLDNDATMSPDGHWAQIRTSDPKTGANEIGLIDLTQVAAAPKVVQYWSGDGTCGWVDATTLLCRAPGQNLQRLRVGSPDASPVQVPGVTDYRTTLVLPLQSMP